MPRRSAPLRPERSGGAAAKATAPRLAAVRKVFHRTICQPSASGVARRGSSSVGATSGAPAAEPVRSRGAWVVSKTRESGHCLRQPAAGGRSAADGTRCSGARKADRDNSSALRRVARRDAEQPQECGAAAGIGGSCGQNRGSCAPLQPLMMRRSVHRQRARSVPAPAPEWRPVRPARRRRHGSHPPRHGALQRLMRLSVRRQGTRRVPAPAPEWRPARPAWRRRHRSHSLRRRPRTAAPRQRRARLLERHPRGRRLPVQRALTDAVQQRWPLSRSGSAFRHRRRQRAARQ